MTPPGDDEPSDGSEDEFRLDAGDSGPDESSRDRRGGETASDGTAGDESTVDETAGDDATSRVPFDADDGPPPVNRAGGATTPPPATGTDEGTRAVGRETGVTTDEEDDGLGWQAFAYDIASSVLAVVLVGLLLFAVSGVWPPLVAVESPSMDPHMKKGDLVFVMEEHRFPGANAHGSTGVVTLRQAAADYTKFQKRGDVIVFAPNGDEQRVPIIHRAMFWVEKGERWYDEANREYVGSADSCEELSHCPAEHAGFVTKGDNNPVYDQVRGLEPVKPAWVVGTAELRVPGLGWVRLRSSRALQTGGSVSATLDGNVTASTAANATG